MSTQTLKKSKNAALISAKSLIFRLLFGASSFVLAPTFEENDGIYVVGVVFFLQKNFDFLLSQF